MEHEELWDAVLRIESQLAKIQKDLDDLRHNEVRNVKLEAWQLENRVSAVEHGLQSVERVCR
jgi:regulator of replication initiation timing